MSNELILLCSVPVVFGAVLLAYKFFGKAGLFAFTAAITILANIEVIVLVDAFGIRQTLGNVLFAATFLITDILSECEGKREADRAVYIGIAVSVFFLIISQSWFLYTPAPQDTALAVIQTAFARTPRMLIASFLVYAVCQLLDVWLYHRVWHFTAKRAGDSRRLLWLRNTLATVVSQLVNAALFTLFAFGGVYDRQTLVGVFISSFAVYAATSLLDTPFVYLARRIGEKRHG